MKNHTTHAINLKILKSISILIDISVYFFKKWFQKNLSLSSLTQQLEESFTDRDFEIISVVENENGKIMPLTPLSLEL